MVLPESLFISIKVECGTSLDINITGVAQSAQNAGQLGGHIPSEYILKSELPNAQQVLKPFAFKITHASGKVAAFTVLLVTPGSIDTVLDLISEIKKSYNITATEGYAPLVGSIFDSAPSEILPTNGHPITYAIFRSNVFYIYAGVGSADNYLGGVIESLQ